MIYRLLENFKLTDLKDMNSNDMKLLSKEIRDALIQKVSLTGGHLASNLGVVELTIAIHKVFKSPEDQIVFDVGHQCYVHKMLTGRLDSFSTLRKKNGLSGFPNPDESEHDVFKTGHSSTSISSALGLISAKDIKGNNNSSVVAVIGDGSITGGLAYEGLNNAGSSNKNIVVILNDNKMSISKNVGAISKALSRMRTKSGYFATKDFFGSILMHIPYIGKSIYRRLNRLKSAIKSYFYSPNIFESMGFKYIGPIDGHNIDLLVRVLNRAKSLNRPVLVHVNTKKGKGYHHAENKPREFHGVSKFDIDTGNTNNTSRLTFTDVFGQTLVKLAENDDRICAITAAMGTSCGLSKFQELYPSRYFDVGIAEQHAVTFASGLSKNGMIPVFAVYFTFLQRSYDQLIHDVSLQNFRMVLAIDRAGIVGEDGETHQGLFDIPMLISIPNIKIFAPSTATELSALLKRAVYVEDKISAVRYPRANSIEYINYPFSKYDCDWEIISKNSKKAIISYGTEIFEVLEAAKEYSIDIIKLNLINFFGGIIEKLICYETIIFVEECYKIGGIGMLLQSCLYENGYEGKYIIRAIENSYIKHSTQAEAKRDCLIDSKSLKILIDSVI